MSQILCPWEYPIWFLFSSNVPFLLPYSHFIALVSAILAALFLLKSREYLFGKIFLFMSLLFSIWVFIDWHVWATNRSDMVMFLWSTQIFVELATYATALYLTYVFTQKNRPKPAYEFLGILSLLPVIVLLPTRFILSGIDISYCDAAEHPFIVFYSYIFEIISVFLILHLISKGIKNSERTQKITVLLFGFGIITFLLAFTSGNIIGSITENWGYAQFGLFGMPLFLGILSYSIMRYKAFDTKTFGAQILVAILMLMTGGILFLRTIERVRVVTSITLVFLAVLGTLLIRSVKKEIEQRERIEKLAVDLEKANEKLKGLDQLKSEFLSLATHQIRAPLTAIKGYSSMLLEGDFGVLPEKAKGSIKTIMGSCQNLINIVGDFLNISRIEQGRMVYEKSVFDVGELVKEVITEIKPNIEKTGLSFETDISTEEIKIKADRSKIKQVVGNIIDNAMKYTPKGKISVSVYKEENKVKIRVKDNGVGIDPREIDKLFNKFSRAKDANKVNVVGTGLGLYIAKKMAEAHNGDIKVSSDGEGKGSTFIIELPLINR